MSSLDAAQELSLEDDQRTAVCGVALFLMGIVAATMLGALIARRCGYEGQAVAGILAGGGTLFLSSLSAIPLLWIRRKNSVALVQSVIVIKSAISFVLVLILVSLVGLPAEAVAVGVMAALPAVLLTAAGLSATSRWRRQT